MLTSVIYKIFLNRDGNLDIAEIHEEEYNSWEGRDFMTDESGKELTFDTKTDAVNWMREHCQPEFIASEFRKIDWSKYRKK